MLGQREQIHRLYNKITLVRDSNYKIEMQPNNSAFLFTFATYRYRSTHLLSEDKYLKETLSLFSI